MSTIRFDHSREIDPHFEAIGDEVAERYPAEERKMDFTSRGRVRRAMVRAEKSQPSPNRESRVMPTILDTEVVMEPELAEEHDVIHQDAATEAAPEDAWTPSRLRENTPQAA